MAETKTPKGKVTIRHVASDAGVSVAAVSKVLRNAYGVSDQLRDKVQKSITKLQYRPSTAARGMRGHTYSVGMLLVGMQNPFLPQIVEGTTEALKRAGYKTLIAVGESDASIEQSLIDSMIDLQMDGLILVAPRLSGEDLAGYARQCPMVVVGHHEPEAEAFDTINCDDFEGGRIATEALLNNGCKRVHMVSPPTVNGDLEVSALRERGYLQAMAAAGRSDQAKIWHIRERPEGPGEPMTDLFEQGVPPDGVFCWSDMHGIELLNLAHTNGVKVPEQLSVVGFDNNTVASMPMVGLASMEQHGHRLGHDAAAALLSRLEGRSDARHQLVMPTLTPRRSLG